VISITWAGTYTHRRYFTHFGQLTPKGTNAMWPVFPQRLQSALKALCCLAGMGKPAQSQEIAECIHVSKAETAKILQLLVWGGFVVSRRGAKGGFHLAAKANHITLGEVIDFFLSRHPFEPDTDFSVMRVLEKTNAPCRKAFARLSLADIERVRQTKRPKKARAARARRRTSSRPKTGALRRKDR
jgi:Rrf2 family protein